MISINVMTQQLRKMLNLRRWRERHPFLNKQRNKAWQDSNSQKRREAQRKRRALNPEQTRKYSRDWVKNNPDKSRAACRKFYTANIKEQRARVSAWIKANPEKVRANNHRRRARVEGVGGSFTAEQFKALGNICLCCKRGDIELSRVGLMLVPDHVLPIVLGGSNDISNIQPLCHGKGGCNNRKHAKYIDYRTEGLCA